jgi:hypothetical protein
MGIYAGEFMCQSQSVPEKPVAEQHPGMAANLGYAGRRGHLGNGGRSTYVTAQPPLGKGVAQQSCNLYPDVVKHPA